LEEKVSQDLEKVVGSVKGIEKVDSGINGRSYVITIVVSHPHVEYPKEIEDEGDKANNSSMSGSWKEYRRLIKEFQNTPEFKEQIEKIGKWESNLRFGKVELIWEQK
jgi:hypothetical protein